MKMHLLLAIAGLSIATSAWAAPQETGEIVSIDPMASTFTVQTDAGDRIDFHTAATTRMTRDDAVVALGDLIVGSRVRVTADAPVGMEPRHATRVELLAAETAGTEPDPATADTRLASNNQLPSTASPLPLIGLLGGGGMLAGVMLRKLRR